MKQKLPNIVDETTPVFLTWMESCKKGFTEYYRREFSKLIQPELVFDIGSRYIKVREITIDPATGKHIHDSVWTFIDRTNGDVLKPASYNAPAKGARGNIFDENNGMLLMGPYGPAYLKGPTTGTFVQWQAKWAK